MRVIEVVCQRVLTGIRGLRVDILVTFQREDHRFVRDRQAVARSRLLDNASFCKGVSKQLGRSVTSGWLKSIELHEAVIDEKSDERRHDVLDGRDRDALMSDGCSSRLFDRVVNEGRYDVRTTDIDALKGNAVILRSGEKPQRDVCPAEQANACDGRRSSDRALVAHGEVNVLRG